MHLVTNAGQSAVTYVSQRKCVAEPNGLLNERTELILNAAIVTNLDAAKKSCGQSRRCRSASVRPGHMGKLVPKPFSIMAHEQYENEIKFFKYTYIIISLFSIF